MALKELREKQAKLVADARAKLDDITDKTDAARAGEIEREHDAIMAEYDALEAKCEREAKLEEAEKRQTAPDPRRPTGRDDVINPEKAAAAAARGAFNSYLRRGIEGMSPEERACMVRPSAEARAQGIASGSAGDYLVAQDFMKELMVTLKAYGPMNDDGVVRVVETGDGKLLPWPTLDDTANEGALIAENTQVSTATLTFGTKQLTAYKYTTNVVLVSSELLQDASIDVEKIVRDAMAVRFGRIANHDLTVGTGSSQPNGVVTAAAANTTAASSTAIAFDDLISLEHALDPLYRGNPNVRFMFADSTLQAVRKLKDSVGQYIWQPGQPAGGLTDYAPPRLLGYRYEVNQAMATIASGHISAIFGDFDRYVHRRVKDFAIRRLVERYADYDQVGFIGFGRLDGNLIDAAAVQALTHP